MKSNLRIGVLVAVLFFSVFAIQLNAAQSTFNIVTVPKFTFNLANYTTINAAAGGEIGIFGTKIIISPGTYVDVNGKQYSNYNVSLIYFTVSGVGLPKNDQQATSTSGAIGIEVNGEISDSVRFVDSSGNPDPIKLIMGGSNRTLSTWKWSGGSISGLNYTGGSYAYP
ncbi:hypothetical protein M1583_01350, partial [Candidatus Marsarchaeota archaeon]|nr:hypothetical protein [Candidatus Marsarchaeota archaeon]